MIRVGKKGIVVCPQRRPVPSQGVHWARSMTRVAIAGHVSSSASSRQKKLSIGNPDLIALRERVMDGDSEWAKHVFRCLFGMRTLNAVQLHKRSLPGLQRPGQ
jgi:hypothetical protein